MPLGMSSTATPAPPAYSAFGDLALLYSAPRAATVKAAADGKLWVMQRGVYTAIQRTDQEQVCVWAGARRGGALGGGGLAPASGAVR